jgi:hypothetical protein
MKRMSLLAVALVATAAYLTGCCCCGGGGTGTPPVPGALEASVGQPSLPSLPTRTLTAGAAMAH